MIRTITQCYACAPAAISLAKKIYEALGNCDRTDKLSYLRDC